MSDITLAPNYQNAINQATNHYQIMLDFVKAAMLKDIDYGIIPGTTKPTLLKPGAEKLCKLFQLRPHFELIHSVVEFEGNGLFHYHYKCSLIRAGEIVGTGEGNCNSREKKYLSQSAFNVANTICKMAQKRALVAAVLVCCGGSKFFTQDMED